MDLGLTGRVALITGAGSQKGFGKGIAMTLAREGCDIIAADIDLAGAEGTAEAVRALGRKALAIKADITNEADMQNMAKTAVAQFGRIDILVNNAGGSSPPQVFVETTQAKWQRDFDVNLMGVLNCTRAVLPYMVAQKRGDIISISSMAGVTGTPTGTIYAAAKAGVINFTMSLAQEVADLGIKVNCLAPGFGATEFYNQFPAEFRERARKMEAAGKTTTPEDIGVAVAFLASDLSIRLVGQCLHVSGMMSPRK